MVTVNITHCDRCGVVIRDNEKYSFIARKVFNPKTKLHENRRDLDLCDWCSQAFIKFIDGELN